MIPGRELDALVAEKVMGIAPFDMPSVQVKDGFDKVVVGIIANEWLKRQEVPNYSTDIAAAFDVLSAMEKLRQGWDYWQLNKNVCRWYSSEQNGREGNPNVMATGESTAHAICLAALKAVGVEV
jgi:hypothetical protein